MKSCQRYYTLVNTATFVVLDPTDLGATTVVAPGLMFDNFLPIPDAESLQFYPSVLKLVV